MTKPRKTEPDQVDILEYNRRAWDHLVAHKNEWTVPVTPAAVAAARAGDWNIVLTPTRHVPREWFPPLDGTETLCLASGGGQQGPILAAAGAAVTVFDNSPRQLGQDRMVAERDGLDITTVQGDMRDLGVFGDGTFGLIINAVSTCFVPDVRVVWTEVARVLRPGGVFLGGFINPLIFLFDVAPAEKGRLEVRHRLPYSDLMSLSNDERKHLEDAHEPFSFSHSIEDLLGGQADAGLRITGVLEDTWPGHVISDFAPTFIMTRALKP